MDPVIINRTSIMTFTKRVSLQEMAKENIWQTKSYFLFTFFHSASNYDSLSEEAIFRFVLFGKADYVKKRMLLPNG